MIRWGSKEYDDRKLKAAYIILVILTVISFIGVIIIIAFYGAIMQSAINEAALKFYIIIIIVTLSISISIQAYLICKLKRLREILNGYVGLIDNVWVLL